MLYKKKQKEIMSKKKKRVVARMRDMLRVRADAGENLRRSGARSLSPLMIRESKTEATFLYIFETILENL